MDSILNRISVKGGFLVFIAYVVTASVAAADQEAKKQLAATSQALTEAGSLSYDYVFEGADTYAGQPNRFAGHFTGTVRLRPATAQNNMIFHATVKGRLTRDAPEMQLTLATDGITACELDHVAATLTCGEVAKGARGLLGWAAYVVLPEFAIPSLFEQTLGYDEIISIKGRRVNGVETEGVLVRLHLPSGPREVQWLLGREDKLPRAQVWTDRMDGLKGEMQFEIHNLRTGLDLSDSAFQVEPTGQVRRVEDPGPFISADRPAPDFRLTTAAGEPVSLAHLRGQYVLLYFWMPACGYCKVIEPDLIALTSAIRRQDIAIELLGINIFPLPEEELRQVLPPPETGLKLVFEPEGTPADYRVAATPTLTLIDPAGTIRFHSTGAGREDMKALSALILE